MKKDLIKIFFISGIKLAFLGVFFYSLYVVFDYVIDFFYKDIFKENIYNNLNYGYEKVKMFIYSNITLVSILWFVSNLWILFFCCEISEKSLIPSYLKKILLFFIFISFFVGVIIVIEYLKTEKVFLAMLIMAVYVFAFKLVFEIILKNNKEIDKQLEFDF